MDFGNFYLLACWQTTSTSTMDFPFSFDRQPFTNPQTLSAPSTQVESLTLPELMKNQHVQTMCNNWKDASTQIVQGAQMQQKLWTKNTQLNAEIQAIQESHQQTLYVVQHPSHIQLINYYSCRLQVRDSSTSLHSPSIAPSDSISRNDSGSCVS